MNVLTRISPALVLSLLTSAAAFGSIQKKPPQSELLKFAIIDSWIGSHTGTMESDFEMKDPCSVEIRWTQPNSTLSIKINGKAIESKPEIQILEGDGWKIVTTEEREEENYDRATLYVGKTGIIATRTTSNEISGKTRVMSICEDLRKN